jgi:hypothetical protein
MCLCGGRVKCGDTSGYGPDYWWTFPSNYQFLQRIFLAGSLVDFIYTFLSLVMFIAAIFFAAILIYRDSRYLALAITYSTALVSILLFGYISETRVFIEIIPLVILGSSMLFHHGGITRNQNPNGSL